MQKRSLIGLSTGLAAALTWELYSVPVRKVSQTGDMPTASAIILAGCIPTSLIFGALFLGEVIKPLFLFGGLLIGIGLVIASTEK